MGADLLETLEILTKFVVQDVGHHLGGLAVLDVALPDQEPVRDLVLARILLNRHQLLDLILVELTSPPGQGDVGLLQAEVGVTTTNTLDGGEGEHDAGLAVNVGVQHTENVLEVGRNNQRHLGKVA